MLYFCVVRKVNTVYLTVSHDVDCCCLHVCAHTSLLSTIALLLGSPWLHSKHEVQRERICVLSDRVLSSPGTGVRRVRR